MSTCRRSRPVMSGFCSEPDSANSFSMILWVSTNQVWSWPVLMMCASVPSVSKPGNSGGGSRWPRASSHSDDGPGMMRMPWRVQIGSQLWIALGVVPHPVGVDHVAAGRLRDLEHPPVDVVGDPGDHGLRRLAEPLRPVGPHQLVVGADAARGDEHDRRLERELAGDRPRARLPAARAARLEPLAAHAGHRAAAQRQRVDLVAEAQLDEAARLRIAHPAHERLEHARGRCPR